MASETAPKAPTVELSVPQIAWHAREPIQSVDVTASGLIATAGNDNEVRLWRLRPSSGAKGGGLSFVQDLSGHNKPVNVVRFCPAGETLASAGDDGMVMLWRERAARAPAFGESSSAERNSDTSWTAVCALRGHTSDVYGAQPPAPAALSAAAPRHRPSPPPNPSPARTCGSR